MGLTGEGPLLPRLAAVEEEDNAFCASLYADYLADSDKGQAVSLEEAAAALGVTLPQS